jgi:hypothetical protein
MCTITRNGFMEERELCLAFRLDQQYGYGEQNRQGVFGECRDRIDTCNDGAVSMITYLSIRLHIEQDRY